VTGTLAWLIYGFGIGMVLTLGTCPSFCFSLYASLVISFDDPIGSRSAVEVRFAGACSSPQH
jgi:hypothetical protein